MLCLWNRLQGEPLHTWPNLNTNHCPSGLASKVTEAEVTSSEVRQSSEDPSKDVFVIYGSYPAQSSPDSSSSFPIIPTFTVGHNGMSALFKSKGIFECTLWESILARNISTLVSVGLNTLGRIGNHFPMYSSKSRCHKVPCLVQCSFSSNVTTH